MDKIAKPKIKKTNVQSAADLFPKDVESIRILTERAKRMASHEVKQSRSADMVMYIKFKLGQETYGVPFFSIKEVLPTMSITYLPHVPDFFMGVINRRGMFIAVINLQRYFRIAETTTHKHENIIILENQNRLLGIAADRIDGIDKYDQIQMNAAFHPIGIIKKDYIVGLHEGVTTVLRTENIIQDIENQCQELEKKFQ